MEFLACRAPTQAAGDHMTSRTARCVPRRAARRAVAVVQSPPNAPAVAKPARGYCRTSSNRPARHSQCVRSARNCRGGLRLWRLVSQEASAALGPMLGPQATKTTRRTSSSIRSQEDVEIIASVAWISCTISSHDQGICSPPRDAAAGSANAQPVYLRGAKPSVARNAEGNKMNNATSYAAAALIVISSVQLAAAAPRHHQTTTDRVAVHQQNRNSDAFAYWPSEQQNWRDPGPAIYSGGYSAPAGR